LRWALFIALLVLAPIVAAWLVLIELSVCYAAVDYIGQRFLG
jgi:hypothetical protein